MSSLYPDIDPEGLLEYSVVFTDRSVNSMSQQFQSVMRGLHEELTSVYNASSCVLVPGGGSYAMEAVARQFARNEKVLVVRNGWFSYRWTQIFDQGVAPAHAEIVCARPDTPEADQQFSPAPIEDICAAITANRPSVVVAPHVETSAGLLMPDEFIAQIASTAHEVGAIFVLDCVASGALWVDMGALGVDVLISAPQKGWTSTPCAGVVMLSDAALARMEDTESDSFVLNLKKWHQIMGAYLGGGHAYHATMPTDGISQFYQAVLEIKKFGYANAKQAQIELGTKLRGIMEQRGFKSLTADGFKSPTVIVSHTDRDDMKSGAAFAAQGVQIAAGVPLECGESDQFKTFRIGLFGLDKLANIERTISVFTEKLDSVA
ncbi:MAG: aminotransferase class V-fold PLP-dependent enzyme [Candidatus Puniceispirillaceae bacterium]|jgi:aspartate aminotransferase-like enzyme